MIHCDSSDKSSHTARWVIISRQLLGRLGLSRASIVGGVPLGARFLRKWRGWLPWLCFLFAQQPLYLIEAPLQIRGQDCTQLKAEERRQAGCDSGLNFACIDVCNQAVHGFLDCTRLFQFGERIDTLRPGRTLVLSADSTEFGGFVGIRVEEA